MTNDLVGGLATLNRYIDKANKAGGEDFPKVDWLKLKDGESVKLSFLNEFKSSPDFNEKAGEVLIAAEHSPSDLFPKKMECTAGEQGDAPCYGCEMNKKHPRTGWAPKGRFYSNVLVDNGTEPPKVMVLSQGMSGKSITPTLAMIAGDTGSISNLQWRMKRSGSNKNNTEYAIVPIMGSKGVNPDNYELFDLKRVCVRHVPYEEQAAFWGLEEAEEVSEDSDADFSW
jgi:hypothetical protein